MPNWKKVITSGSDAALNSLLVTNSLTASGLIYPSTDGTTGQVVTTDGAGNLSFSNVENTTISIKNVSGVTIQKGTPCYITGSGTSGNLAGVFPADAANPLRMPAGVIAGETLTAGSEGIGLINGFISNVNTSAFGAGDTIYVAVGGGYTNVRPTGSSILVQKLGNVEKSHPSNGSGVINGPGYYNDLPNVQSGYTWVGNSNGVAVAIATSSIQNVVSSSYALSASHASSTAAVAGTTNYVSKFTSGTTIGNSLIFDNGTNVGIGTAIPDAKLDVVGSGIFRDRLIVSADAGNEQFVIQRASNTNAQLIFGYHSSGYGRIQAVEQSVGYKPLVLNLNGGNVGIGTDNPQSKLHVYTDADVWHTRIGGASGELRIGGQTSSGAVIQAYTPGGSVIDLYLQRDGGNIGIGTTSPLALLSVGAGSIADANVPIQISSEGSGTQRWIGINKNGNYGVIIGYVENGSLAGNGAYIRQVTSDPLHFTVNNSTTAMTMLSSGNVGINTSIPAYKLSVVGKMDLNDGVGSIFIGTNAGLSDDNTNKSVSIGLNASQNNIVGSNIVAIGNESQKNNLQSNNTSVGSNTLEFNTTGTANTAIGSYALWNNINGSSNVAIGPSTLLSNTSGSVNDALGASALRINTSGSNNVAMGALSLRNNVLGNDNTALGNAAGRYEGTGTTSNTDPSASIFIGRNSRANASNQTNQIVIGNEALGLGSNTVVLGNDSIVTTALKGNVGIGITNPSSILSIYKGSGENAYIEVAGNGNTIGTTSVVYGQDSSNNGYFWNRANAPLYFGTNNSTKMFLSAGGSLLVGDTINPAENPWYGTAVFGKNGTDKVITGYLSSSTNGAIIGGHNSALDAWAPLNIDGTELRFNIQQSRKMTLTSGGSLVVGETSSIWETSGRGVIQVNGSSTALLGLSIAGANSSYLYNDGANLFLWNTLNGYMALATNNTTRMTIAAGGALRLHTYGSGTNTGTAAYNLAVDSSGNVIESTPPTNPVTGTGVDNRVAIWSGTTTQDSSANLTFDGTTLGLTGILQFPQNPVGTTYGNGVSATPPYAITQGAGNDDAIRFYAESAGTNQVSMVFEVNDDIETAGSEWIWRNKQTYGGYLATTPMRLSGTGAATFLSSVTANSYTISSGGSDSVLSFLNNASGGARSISYSVSTAAITITDVSGNPNVTILNGGNVGIGTTIPGTPLHVAGGPTGTGGWNKTATLSATYPGLIFNSNATKWGGMAYDHTEAMRFWVNAGSDDIFAGTLAMSILNGGNIGIGVTNPGQKLEVNGRTLVNQFQYTKAINYSSNDLNSLVTAGFYDGEGMTNAPNSGWFWVTVEKYSGDDNWVHQTATSFGSLNTANEVYTRVRSGGSWGAWKELTSNTGTVTSVGGTGTVNGITLTGTVTASGSLTLGGTLSGIGNSQLTNSSITIGSTSISLGSSATTIAGLSSVTSTTFVGALTGNASTATNLSTNRTNWSTNGTISAVVGQLAWKNYSNSHTIFDASAGLSPDNTSCSNTNPDAAWTGTYPTLMGWNGANTYGVRVDSARSADSTAAVAGNTNYIPKFTSGTAIGNSIIYEDSSKIGIGTTGPGEKLEVNGNIKLSSTAGATSTPSYIWLGQDYSNGATRDKLKIYLYNGGTEQYGFSVGSNSDVQYHSNGRHDFYLANSATATLNSTGLGIGVTSPNGKLQVNGNAYFGTFLNTDIRYSFVSSGALSSYHTYIDNTNSSGGTYGLGVNSNNTSTNGYILGLSSGGTERMIVRNDGYVGIGTSSPGYKLDVNGDTNITGTLTATVKSFIIDHPTKENKKLQYGVLEGPEHSVYVRGKLTNTNVIQLPDYWHALVHEDSITVNLTAIGKPQEIWVEEITDTYITVGSLAENINCFYTVFAERKDIDKLVTEFDKE